MGTGDVSVESARAEVERLREQLRWEQRARELLQRIAVSAAASSSVEKALEDAVQEICRLVGWPIGHVLVRGSGGELQSSGIWSFEDADRFLQFRALSCDLRFAKSVGLPGRVLARAEPLWIMDVTSDDNFPRAEAALACGLRSAFAFPVLSGAGVFAVLEFFSPESRAPDVPLLEVMGTIGVQLGRVIERVRSEQALRESELRFRSVATSAHDAIISADAEGAIISWNRGAAEMFGYTEDEMLGRPLSRVIPARYREAHQRGMERIRAGGERRVIGAKPVELHGSRKSGEEFPLELSLATWRAGDRDYFSGILRDISARKESEERLRNIAVELEASEKRAIAASRAKSTFLASMSHELRTPLNAILGFVQLLDRDPRLQADQRESLAVILHSGEHLLGLINDVLSISKIEAGQMELAPAVFSLARLISGVDQLFRPRCETKGLTLRLELAGGLPELVLGDEHKLRQILINLLSNAVKFTAEGGVVLRVAWSEQRVRFEVEDSGPGIAEEERAALFEPFSQTAAGARLAEGTGLGLVISRNFIRLMGGELELESRPGEGCLFSFEVRLPHADPAAAAAAAAVPVRSPRVIAVRPVLAPGEAAELPRILVADNDLSGRMLLVRLLRAVELEVEDVANGAEAVERWKSWRPHFIWMDMRMPVMDGYRATLEIRRLESLLPEGERPRTAIVALTASAFEHDRPSILAAGCNEIVSKPFREQTIFDVLARFLPVRLVYEGIGPSTPALSLDGLHKIPRAELDALQRVLTEGDDQAALRLVERIRASDEAIAEALARMVKGFQLDALLALLEKRDR